MQQGAFVGVNALKASEKWIAVGMHCFFNSILYNRPKDQYKIIKTIVYDVHEYTHITK